MHKITLLSSLSLLLFLPICKRDFQNKNFIILNSKKQKKFLCTKNKKIDNELKIHIEDFYFFSIVTI